MNIIILYEELADYFVQCINYVANQREDIKFHIFKKEVNKEAPFKFEAINAKIYRREEYSSEELFQLVTSLNPSAICCSGWIYKPYLRICKYYNKHIPVCVFFDNKWQNTLKQNIAALISPFNTKKYFNRCFVPWDSQFKFARKLGFMKDKIFKGLYCCNTNEFHAIYKGSITKKTESFPKRFVYLGRYVEHKGIKLLWEAFSKLVRENKNDGWELWCYGTGDVEPTEYEAIKHFGFVQPKEMNSLLPNLGVYVLPSFLEPWGVTIHEFACAGFPILSSENVGAADLFVEDGYNGHIFKPNSLEAIEEALLKIINVSQDKLLKQANNSYEMSNKITLKTWMDTFIQIIS